MKFVHTLRTLFGVFTLGLLALASQASAAIADFAGSYAVNLASLESPTAGAPAVEMFYGRIDFKVTAAGDASGTLSTRAGKSYPFKTKLAQETGSTTATQRNVGVAPLKGTKNVFLVNFRITINANGTVEITGENFNPGDANAIFYTEGSLKFTAFTGTGPTWVGNYTMALTDPQPSGATIPSGAGYASLVVVKTGELTYTGKLGDGTPLTGKALATAAGDYSLYAAPKTYAAGGYFSADLNLKTRGLQKTSAIWNKPAKTGDKSYPAGFSTTVDVIVQPWLVPAKGAYPFPASLGFGSSKNFEVKFSGSGLTDGTYTANLPDTLRVTGLGVIQAVSGGAGSPAENNSTEWNKLWSVKLNPLTGVFTGTQVVTHVNGGKVVTRKLPVEGVMVLGNTLGTDPFAYGQYRVTPKATGSTELSGEVKFIGPLENNTAVATAGNYTVKIDEEDFVDVVTKVTGAQSPSAKPARPAGSPTDNQVVKFTISEDLKTLTFNGQVLTFVSTGLTGRVYNKVVVPRGIGKAGGQFGVTIQINPTTGAVQGVFGFTQFITLLNISGDSRAQSPVFNALEPPSSSIPKL